MKNCHDSRILKMLYKNFHRLVFYKYIQLLDIKKYEDSDSINSMISKPELDCI